MKKKLSPAEYRKKWGVPDWRDADAYPIVKNMGDRAWRWEFLRRSPEYRDDFERKGNPARYGLAMMVDPRDSAGFIRFECLQVFGRGETVNAVLAIELNPWVTDKEHFNLLRCQLANMRHYLAWRSSSHNARKPWTFYLRALDAEGAENPSEPDLGKVLYPNSKRARQHAEETLEGAHEIQDLFVTPIL